VAGIHPDLNGKLDRIEGKHTAPVVSRPESNVDQWYRNWNASFDAESPNIAKCAKTRNAAA